MSRNINNSVSMDEAKRDFSALIQIAEENGEAFIMEDNEARFVLVDIDKANYIDISDDEKIDVVAARVLKKYHHAFEELAK